jgi:hypothetical protein
LNNAKQSLPDCLEALKRKGSLPLVETILSSGVIALITDVQPLSLNPASLQVVTIVTTPLSHRVVIDPWLALA